MGNNYEKYQSHISSGGGMPTGYKFMVCPKCGRYGVSSRILKSKGKATARKSCKYCSWMEGGTTH